MYTGKGKCAIRRESFHQEQDKNQATQYWSYVQGSQESLFWEALQTMQEAWGPPTTHATKNCHKYKKDGSVKANFCAAKKADKKPKPTKQSFAQLSDKLDKLKKSLKKTPLKSKKRRRCGACLRGSKTLKK